MKKGIIFICIILVVASLMLLGCAKKQPAPTPVPAPQPQIEPSDTSVEAINEDIGSIDKLEDELRFDDFEDLDNTLTDVENI